MLKEIDQKQLKLVTELLQTYLLYATIALIVILAVTALLIKLKAPDKLKAFSKVTLGIIIGYSVAVILGIGSLIISRMYLKDEITYVFWMTAGLILLMIALFTAGAIIKLVKPSAFKIFAIVSTAIVALYAVAMLVALPKTEEDYKPADPVLFYVISAILVALLVIVPLLFGKNNANSTKSITYAAVCIAMSFTLSYIKLFSMPQGGSVTFASLLPIMVYAYMFGARKGVLCGVIYGLLQFLQSPQAYQPLQIIVDYPLAFGFIGFAGVFKGLLKKCKLGRLFEFSLGATVAVCLRFICHILSGACVFYTWMPDTYTNPWIYSIAYNSYVLVDLVIVLVAGVIVLLNGSFNKLLDKTTDTQTETEETN